MSNKLHVGLPGIPDGPDYDLDGGPPGAGRRLEAETSPAKKPKSGAGGEQVSMDALRALLNEQSVALLQAQQTQIDGALQAFEVRQSGRLDVIEQRLVSHTRVQTDLHTGLQDLQDRVAKLEHTQRTAPKVVSESDRGPNRKHTLVFGGWESSTRRAILLQQLQQALQGLSLTSSLDMDPFCTGARRSVALCAFKKRPNEEDMDVRSRMFHVLQTVNSSMVTIEGAPRPLWCSVSKSPEERGRASLAAVIRKVVIRLAPHRQQDLDLEYKTGRAWIREDQLCGMKGTPEEEVRSARVVTTKAGEGWIDEKTLSKWVDSHIDEAIRDSARRPVQKEDLVLLQVPTEKGSWFKVRHLERRVELWIGTMHLTPGAPVAQFEHEVHDLLQGLPKNAHRVVIMGDVNTPFTWNRDVDGVSAVCKEGKGNILHKALVERDLRMGTPSLEQLATPTSRPRQEGRQGTCIDVMASKHVRLDSWYIHEDSYQTIGNDHELCEACLLVDEKRHFPRHVTGPRVWTGGVQQISFLDQEGIEQLARQCTKPATGHGYKDSDEVKQAFREAKRRGTAVLWKKALKMRSEARKQWELARLHRAGQGEWHSFKALKPRREEGWDVGFADAQQGDPHAAVHEHLTEVYQGPEDVTPVQAWEGDVRAFTVEELRVGVQQMKRGKAVGTDLTSTELLLGVMEVPGGEGHLLEWYNRILVTGAIPARWNQPILIMLPKMRAPRKARDLRPIAMGSSVSKLFSRMLLNRSLSLICPQTYAQCSGPGRQTSDFLYTVIRLFELTREWGNPLAVFKLDLAKAFDSVDRQMLLDRLESRIGAGPEMVCWRGLLKGTVGELQTPWGNSSVPMHRGIKQGAVESPVFFAYIAELALADTIHKFCWRNMNPLFPDLPPEEMMYMDDGMLWNGQLSVVQSRAQQLSSEFATYGLRMNPKKCQLYVSPKVVGNSILLEGVTVTASPQLEVMGLSLRVGVSMYELMAPAMTRARSKFWDLKHIFRSKGFMKNRARVMERVVGGTALWFICCVPPDKATMTSLNATQLQLMVWLLRFAKGPNEPWEDFRKRSFRGARAALHSAGLERWSTLWLRRYWRFAGHRVRTSLSDHPPISCDFEHFRTLPWWIHQQSLPQKQGIRHKGHHFPRLTILERGMDHVAGHPWRVHAHDRKRWRSLEDAWVAHMDVPWSSGRQLSIGDL
ncbi:unnamed protein product [Symbiodinium microadriaticum]|nr:unnamed protein product [Symbiodinium sp. KB8]CAE7354179.1 unnamed protein product [Symbiodinium microadriaticum]